MIISLTDTHFTVFAAYDSLFFEPRFAWGKISANYPPTSDRAEVSLPGRTDMSCAASRPTWNYSTDNQDDKMMVYNDRRAGGSSDLCGLKLKWLQESEFITATSALTWMLRHERKQFVSRLVWKLWNSLEKADASTLGSAVAVLLFRCQQEEDCRCTWQLPDVNVCECRSRTLHAQQTSPE